jgi:hypothetical protein
MLKWIKKIKTWFGDLFRTEYWLVWPTGKTISDSWIETGPAPAWTPFFTVAGPLYSLKDIAFARETAAAWEEGRPKRKVWDWGAAVLKNVCKFFDKAPKKSLGFTEDEIIFLREHLRRAEEKEKKEGLNKRKRDRAIGLIRNNPNMKPNRLHSILKSEFGSSISVVAYAQIRRELGFRPKPKLKKTKKTANKIEVASRLIIL